MAATSSDISATAGSDTNQQAPFVGQVKMATTPKSRVEPFRVPELNESTVALLNSLLSRRQAITFDEITLADRPSSVHPNDTRLHSWVSRHIKLKGCGIMSAAMDTVTEAELALALAKSGGIGVIHRNLDAQDQADMVRWVRRKIHYGGMIDRPISFPPHKRLSDVQAAIRERGFTFTSFPIVSEEEGRLVGMLTRDEMDFVSGLEDPPLGELMKPLDTLVHAPVGTTTAQAFDIMRTRHVKKLPVLDAQGQLHGMFVWSDIKKDHHKQDKFSLDEHGNFYVGAAIGVGPNDLERAVRLVEDAHCPLLVIDSSHGACLPALQQIAAIRKRFGDRVDIIAGNVASYESAMYLLKGLDGHRPDGLKVGIGPGSICTTRQVTGHGVPQATAVYDVWRATRDFADQEGYHVPVVADGGIRTSGDIVKCFAMGASGVMLGSVFAGTSESPGLVVQKGGKRYKTIRGMGSRAAMEQRSGSRARYYREESQHQSEKLTSAQKEKMVPEGVEGLVELKGTVELLMNTLLGGVQAGLGHTGADNIRAFQSAAEIWTQSSAGISEGRPHSIQDVRD